jgi:flagellar motor switch protein FliN
MDDINKNDPLPTTGKIVPINTDLLRGMRVTLEVRLGHSEIAVEELMALKVGAVVPLDTALSDQLDIYLNGVLVARGTVVAVGEKFGVRIMEVGAT